VGLTDAAPGSVRGIYAVVEDLDAIRCELLERGVHLDEIRHKSPLKNWRGGWSVLREPRAGRTPRRGTP
jgi:hypothetical protein